MFANRRGRASAAKDTVDVTGLVQTSRSPVNWGISDSGDPLFKYPTAGIAGCCARAATGQVAAPPSSLMNSRRLMRAHPKAKDRKISIAG